VYDQAKQFDCHSPPEIMYALWWNMRSIEKISILPDNFLRIQREIGNINRKTLIGWLVGVHLQLELNQDSLFRAVKLLDKYTSLE
jgi:hypothetical protein